VLTVFPVPVIVDLDADGDMEIVAGSNGGRVYAWDFAATSVSWGGYMNTPNNTGSFQGSLAQPQVATTLLGNLYMYPSPVENLGRARFFLHQSADVTVDILDITGRRIGEVNMSNATHNAYNEVEFDFTRQSNGMYILRIKAENGSKREVKFKKFAVLK
jgi:hypothetical protein